MIFTDAGHGIPAELLRHVSDRFRSSDGGPGGRGAGLGLGRGLTLVCAVARAYGGMCWSKQPGKGSEFEVLLPLRTADRCHRHHRWRWPSSPGRTPPIGRLAQVMRQTTVAGDTNEPVRSVQTLRDTHRRRSPRRFLGSVRHVASSGNGE
jgi:hypothetical protein